MDQAMSAALMADFTSEQIGHKPATWCKACSAAVRERKGKSCSEHRVVKCAKCKTNVTEAHTCLDFVGHADVRARLCTVDPEWTWAPFEFPGTGSLIISDGHPVGLWIMLTIGGVSRPGYGSCDKGKPEPIKELIGDALRNAGLSFGIAWKLWAKGERTSDEGDSAEGGQQQDAREPRGNAAPSGRRQQAPASRGQAPAQAAAPAENTEPNPAEEEWVRDWHARLAGTDDSAGIRGRRLEIARAVGAKIITPDTGNQLSEPLQKRAAEIEAAADKPRSAA